MDRTNEQFEKLLSKYRDKSCSFEELKDLFSYMDVSEYQERLKIIMDEHFETLELLPAAEGVDWRHMLSAILETSPDRKKIRPLWSVIIPVAAAVLIMLSAGIFFWTNQPQVKHTIRDVKASVKKDIAPGGNKAVLKLADGTEIVLDGHATGVLASEGSTRISKTKDGMLVYDAAASGLSGIPAVSEPLINT